MFLRQIVSTFQHLLKASVIIAFQPHRRRVRKNAPTWHKARHPPPGALHHACLIIPASDPERGNRRHDTVYPG